LRPLGNVIYIMPPYIITKAQLEEVYEAISEFLSEQGS
jgi:adenosylmethionine---8-amino-7-oxononanoate aminotransferase